MSVRNTTLQLPSSYFENNPKEAIKSILGNDAIIISYERVPIILPGNYIWINVKYKCLDIDPFKIFKITETKRISNNQEKTDMEFELNSETPKLEFVLTNSSKTKFIVKDIKLYKLN